MDKGQTERTNSGQTLPMVIAPKDSKPSSKPVRPDAAFVVQLLAARDNLAIQRARRRSTDTDASSAYRATGASTVKRIPAGYRRTLDA